MCFIHRMPTDQPVKGPPLHNKEISAKPCGAKRRANQQKALQRSKVGLVHRPSGRQCRRTEGQGPVWRPLTCGAKEFATLDPYRLEIVNANMILHIPARIMPILFSSHGTENFPTEGHGLEPVASEKQRRVTHLQVCRATQQ